VDIKEHVTKSTDNSGFAGESVSLIATVGDDNYTFTKAGVTFANGSYYSGMVRMNSPTWTKIGTGTFTYTGFWDDTSTGLELYRCDSQSNRYKIKSWGKGTPVDYFFLWNSSTNVIATQKKSAGYTHSTFGAVSVGDVSTYVSGKDYADYPSR